MTDFREKFSFEQRRSESTQILRKYQSRTPIIVQTGPDMPIDKFKYLVPNDLTMAQFIYVIRKRLTLRPETAIFIYVNNILPSAMSSIISIYNTYRDDDGFLYFSIKGENTFG